MAIKSITWLVSTYTLIYQNPYDRRTIIREFDQEEDLIRFINKNPRLKQFNWIVNKHVHAKIEEE